jgi:hypothetical protein
MITRWADRLGTGARATPVALRAPSVALAPVPRTVCVSDVMALLSVHDVVALEN